MFAIIALAVQAAGQIYGAVAGERAAGQNRNFARQRAADALQRGEFAAEQYGRELKQVQGQQVVGLAAQGLDVTQGSAAAIQADTARIGARDLEQIRLNAEREAWGIRTQANINYNAQLNQSIAQGIQAVGSVSTLLNNPGNPWESYTGKKSVGGLEKRKGL